MTEKSYTCDRFSDIEYNLKTIQQNIAEAAIKSGRRPEDITFMAVTKTVEPELINHAISCGVDLIGENKVQEFLGKKPYLHLDNCKAHLIGHLQTNKVKQIVGQVDMIQSVDSLKLAQEIAKHSKKLGITTRCLVEVNIGYQETKTGIAPENLMELLTEISKMDGISVEGLMGIPPICDNDVKNREYFSNLHDMFIDIRGKNIDNITMRVLSMGMSSDYVSAIEEGATLVRVGSSLFGQRRY